MRKTIVIHAPYQALDDLEALRESVAVGLVEGVVVLPDGAELTVEELPETQPSDEYWAEVAEQVDGLPDTASLDAAPAPAPEPEPASVAPRGHNAKEKQAIQKRLIDYRQAHGLGCWNEVAALTGKRLTDDDLRNMMTGKGDYPIAQWRAAAKALDQMEGAG